MEQVSRPGMTLEENRDDGLVEETNNLVRFTRISGILLLTVFLLGVQHTKKCDQLSTITIDEQHVVGTHDGLVDYYFQEAKCRALFHEYPASNMGSKEFNH
ncbi:hypothetical protein C5167_004039 [Papaver somniferum]|nr:hypothetical protein C5167_004039 [Papaver somniferum]